jgi:predicted transcriptional regulator of viral defense system
MTAAWIVPSHWRARPALIRRHVDGTVGARPWSQTLCQLSYSRSGDRFSSTASGSKVIVIWIAQASYGAPDEPLCAQAIAVYSDGMKAHNVSNSSLLIDSRGINQENRALLERLHRGLPGPFDAAGAAEALQLPLSRTRKLLSYLARRGWLARVRRGLYVAVPLDARRSGVWVEDAWVVADRVFRPCYVGGWSACEHWDLTEQVFRTIVVVTAKKVRDREPVIQGTQFRVTVRSEDKLFGTTPVWRDGVRVQVSDPGRTVVDVLDDPTLGGGMRNVADIVHEYLNSVHRDDELLIEYADRLGNRAVFKRLGFVIEHLDVEVASLLAACLARRSAGLVDLDPSVDAKGRIVRRWGVRANVTLGTPGGDW